MRHTAWNSLPSPLYRLNVAEQLNPVHFGKLDM